MLPEGMFAPPALADCTCGGVSAAKNWDADVVDGCVKVSESPHPHARIAGKRIIANTTLMVIIGFLLFSENVAAAVQGGFLRLHTTTHWSAIALNDAPVTE
jgi:hypothetical protein